jgi:DNA-binding NarL/FixJ family response regulator
MKKGQTFVLSNEQHEKLIVMLNEGKYLKDIAQEFGVTHTTISNYIKAHKYRDAPRERIPACHI